MARSALDKPRFDAYKLDPFKDVCIITPEKRSDAGPKDRVDPKHPLCETAERPITPEEVEDVASRGILQPIRVLKDGAALAIVVIGRRRVRMARAAQELREKKNKELPKAQRLPPLTVPAMLIQGDDLALRGAMLAENFQRKDYSPTQIAAQLRDFAAMGADLALCASVAGQKTTWVKSHLALPDCAPRVQKAVEAGELSVTAAAKLSDLPREGQVKELDALLAGGKATVAKVDRVVRAARTGKAIETPPSAKVRREVLHRLEAGRGSIGLNERGIAIIVLQWCLTGRLNRDDLDLPLVERKVKGDAAESDDASHAGVS